MKKKNNSLIVHVIYSIIIIAFFIDFYGVAPNKGPLIPGNFQIENAIVRKFSDDSIKQIMIDINDAYSIVNFINELEIERTNNIPDVDSIYSISFYNSNYDIISLRFREDDILSYSYTQRKKKILSNEYRYKYIGDFYQITSQEIDLKIFEELFKLGSN